MTNVRWSHDSSQVASTGGADTALFLWTRENIEIASSSKFEAGPSNVEYRGDSDDSDTDSEEEGGELEFIPKFCRILLALWFKSAIFVNLAVMLGFKLLVNLPKSH